MAKKIAKNSTDANVPTIRASSPEEAKRLLQERGVTLKQFADSKGFKYRTVSEVVRGVNKGLHGEGHQVAVAFGLKRAA